MSREGLLWSLGRQERETALWHDPRWDALAGSALSAADVTALEREAMITHDGRDLLRAFRPLDDAACDRIAERTMAVLAARPSPGNGPPAPPRDVRQSRPSDVRQSLPSDVQPPLPTDVRQSPWNDVPQPGQSPRRSSSPWLRAVLSLGAVLAVAAAAMGLVIGLQKDPAGPMAAEPTPMVDIPGYQLEVTGGDVLHATRGASDDSLSGQPTLLAAGAFVTVLLRPDRPARVPVQMVACVLRDGHARPWDVPWDRSEQGSFHTQGTRESLFSGEPPGELTLLFAVRPAGALPTCEALAASSTPLHHPLQIR